jgi:hypothetical protein
MSAGSMHPARRHVVALAWLVLLAFPLLATAAPRAWLDRDTIRLGETVTLNLETDARGGMEPDFTPLDKDFRRLSTSTSTQLSYVNGKQSARTLWAVALEPTQEGVIGIPAFEIGRERTEPLRLTVLPMPQGGSAAAGDDVFLEVEADPPSPYVQQQVRYVVRLYYAVQLLEGQLEEPQLPAVQMRRLGQDLQYQKTLADRRYTVVERRYALLPEASGTLEIPGPNFRGRALLTGGYGSLMSRNALLQARGNQLTLEVRSRPAGAREPWLPAQSLQLTDESGALPTEIKVGEPLTLTLRLSAQGLAAEQLPELRLPAIDGAEIYPDQETSQTSDDGQWLRAERVRKFALVPTRAGVLQLPEVAIEWWNLTLDRPERAVLAARQLQVVGGPSVAAAPAPDPATDAPAAEGATDATTPWDWQRVAPWLAGVFALLWLATLAAFWQRGRRPARTERRRAAPAVPDWRGAWRGALDRQDLPAAASALILAAQQHHPAARNLGDVAAQLQSEPQCDALRRLEQVLYAGHTDAALPAALRAAFASGPAWRRDVAPATADGLPELYPSRDGRS